jgi:hypothetical protein
MSRQVILYLLPAINKIPAKDSGVSLRVVINDKEIGNIELSL